MLKIGIIGMGRMGKIHLNNLTHKIENVEVVAVVTRGKEGQQFALSKGIVDVSDSIDIILNNNEIDAVIICSPNSTHADYALQIAKSGKAIFCEKPIDMSLEKANRVINQISEFGVPIMIGFNQRFDYNFSKVKEQVSNGAVGEIRSLRITSRDPQPPPISYIKESGGLFRDMTIHDFDLARFIMNSEVEEVFAYGVCLIDENIEKAGDIDCATVVLKFKNKAVCTIENSRDTNYGYDQRMEVFGSKGMLNVNNPLKSDVVSVTNSGTSTDVNLDFFIDRYEKSYLEELSSFIDALKNKKPMAVNGSDGIQAMIIAEAANSSLKENRPIKINSIKLK